MASSLFFAAGGLWSAEAVPSATRQTPPPLSPEESRKQIRLPDGFQVELVAAEPLVLDPVAFDWDERGRLWVVEMADYPLGTDGKGKAGGRVRILEDSDRDGFYDRSTLFAEGLRFPTGILTWRGGCLVTAAPDILRLEDRDGDGRAESREVLFTGFNTGNEQLLINGLRWGVDGWVYCANGGHNVNYGKDVNITSLRTGAKVALGARDFRFKPETGELDPLSGPAQFGRTRDAWGRWFGVQNSYPLWHYALEDRYLRRNPHLAPPSPKVLLTESNPRVFPALEPEQRYHNFAQAGRFTSACGPVIVADPLLFGVDQAEVENAFVCEPVHGIVQRLRVMPDGPSFTATRVGGEVDFFASEDRWCRPVMARTGPDGALWVADMYRYMIEHPHWLPETGRKELAPHYRRGEDRGRIYRVFPTGRRPDTAVALDGANAAELVRTLDSPNGWQRDKAQMLLQWRRERASVTLLQELARDPARPLGRMYALHMLEFFNALDDDVLVAGLTDPAAGVRVNALALAERRTSDRVVAAAVKLTADPDARVRLQLACSLGEWTQNIAGEALADMARRDGANPLFHGALVSSLLPHLAVIAKSGGAELLAEAVIRTALGAKRDDITLAMLEVPFTRASVADPASLEQLRATLMVLRAQDQTLESLGARHAVDSRWAALVARRDTVFTAIDDAMPTAPPRKQAFYATLLICDPAKESAAIELLGKLLAPGHGLHPIGEYAAQIARIGNERGFEVLVRDWSQRTPGDRNVILDVILSRDTWVAKLLDRVAAAEIPAGSFDPQRRARLLRHPTPAIRRKAETIFNSRGGRPRSQVIAAFRPALALAGDPTQGREVFAQVCAACHQLGGTGTAIGPDLRSVVDHPPEKLLSSILDPNLDIQPGYAAYFCELAGGEQIYGAIISETGGSLTFRLADGSTRAVVRGQIKSLQSSNVSLMPEGLESTMTPQSLANLIAFLKKRQD